MKIMKYEHKLKVFIRFLKKNKIYHKFFSNASSINGFEIRERIFSSMTVEEFIQFELNKKGWGNIFNMAFEWNRTKEGYDFWYDIYILWSKTIRVYHDKNIYPF